MIFCNNCGNAFGEGLNFCTECGTPTPQMRTEDPSPTLQIVGSARATVAASSDVQIPSIQYVGPQPVATPPSPNYPLDNGQSTPKTKQPSPVLIVVIVGAVLILSVVVVVYFALRSNTPQSTSKGTTYSTGSSADNVANLLDQAINNNRLVTLNNDDAYTYYTQLRSINPQHPALTDIKSRVLPKLVDLGDETINRRTYHTGLVSNEDWRNSVRVYEWAHQLEPNDHTHEAKWKYLIGKLAENEKRFEEAWENIYSASQLNPAWAAPQNDLGLLVQARENGRQKYSNSIPYFEKAIQLQSDWDIPHNNLGSAYFYLGDYDTAESYYNKAIQLNSNWARPHKWLGDVYSKKGMNAAALQEYQTANNLYDPNKDSLDIDYVRLRVSQLHAVGY